MQAALSRKRQVSSVMPLGSLVRGLMGGMLSGLARQSDGFRSAMLRRL